MKLKEMFNSFIYKTPTKLNSEYSVEHTPNYKDNKGKKLPWKSTNTNAAGDTVTKHYATEQEMDKVTQVEDPKYILYDFYFLVGYVYNQDFSMIRKKADYRIVPGGEREENINFIFNEAVKDCVDKLTIHMTRAMKFSLSAEFKHITDYCHLVVDIAKEAKSKKDAREELKQAVSPNTYKFIVEYLSTFPLFYNASGSNAKNLYSLFNPAMDIDRSKEYRGPLKKEPGKKYDKQYKAVVATQKRIGFSDEELAEVFIEIFNDDKGWASRFGGEAWLRIAQAYKNLLEATSTQDKIVWCDHAYDLQHNTGTVFNKIQGYYSSGFDWIKNALDWKRDNTSIKEFRERVSPQLKPIVDYVAKHGGEGSLLGIEHEIPQIIQLQKEIKREVPNVSVEYASANNVKIGDRLRYSPQYLQHFSKEIQDNHSNYIFIVVTTDDTQMVLVKEGGNKNGSENFSSPYRNTSGLYLYVHVLENKEEDSSDEVVTAENWLPYGNYLTVGNIEVYPTNAPNNMTWDEANEYCKSLGEGWRLPTKDELNLMYTNLKQAGLGGFGKDWFWSSSQISNVSAWYQNFSDGYQSYDNKSSSVSVRACRAYGNYLTVGNIEVYPTNAPREMTWDEANEYCKSLGEGWRLPTKDELNQMYQLKDEIDGFGEGWLWSSSQSSNVYAWFQGFSYGEQGNGNKSNVYSVRACRALTI